MKCKLRELSSPWGSENLETRQDRAEGAPGAQATVIATSTNEPLADGT